MISTLLLNRYELLEKIGEGGMGIVYKAKCHLLNRFVAVKILKSELNNYEDFVAKFRREANSVASLSHQNIVNVYDIGSENNIDFIVMEYINGKTLKQVINQNVKLSPRKAIEISLQIAKALECAHKNNIIHRDIKPDNILITEDNIVKVADFGIAKVVDSSTLTNSNNVIGSVHYFSPEQAKGRSVDCRTDIYSLGIVMYEMVTGQVPYNAESSISVAIMHINEPVIPPKEVITDIPEDINQSILKALEKEPINRYRTAKEMVSILNAIKEDFDLKLKLYNRSMETTMVMMAEPLVVSDTEHDFTTVMSQVAVPENPLIKKDRKVPSKDKGINNNKKRMIIVGSIILLMIIGIFGEYLSNRPSTAVAAPIAKTTVPEASMKLPADEKKLVPSLIGKAQDIAENTIVNNGFLIGNISSDYSDSIAKGLIISQSPAVNASYEKNGKIDFVISQGQKVVQVTPQLRGNNKKE
ncbi:protein kinase [Clostridium gelidum]|uniref:non-specific serine/threonine protein kinase n=1 Tax=Clostridium gelidum TaxID=704125 RepID=A0ABM7T3J2_9CLOT|nr:Stk1 family PASTA domain-containing Ser/Thr kinase [Clostridium gelidum]BCZ45484.1 protein kinase [Clostridium gelidum]